MRRGLSEKDAAEAAGICEKSWYNWKARARAAADILPADWERLRFDELLACLDELEIDRAGVRKTGANGRLTRADVIDVLRTRAGRYLEFLAELKACAPQRKLAILTSLDDLIQGRARLKRTKSVQRVRLPNGSDAIVTTEIVELPPDRIAALRMLAMNWPEEFGGRGSQDDAELSAKAVTEAVQRMLSTVPPAPALPPAPEIPEAKK